MRLRHIISLLLFTSALCVFLRTEQLTYTLESETGFVKPQYSAQNTAILIAVFFAVVVMGIIASAVKVTKKNFKIVGARMFLPSILLAISYVCDGINFLSLQSVFGWQNILSSALGILSAVFFVAYGAQAVFGFKINGTYFIVPVIYSLFNLISIFVSTATIAIISDNILVLLTKSAQLLFMLEFAKTANGIGNTKNHKKFAAIGAVAAMLSLISSLPQIIILITGGAYRLHQGLSSVIADCLTSVFIIVLLTFYFRENTSKIQKH